MSAPYQPWVEYPHIWKSESAYLSFVRGGIRRYLWSKNPVKLEFEKESTVQIPNDNPRSIKRFPTVAGGRCTICSGLFKRTEMECDHLTGEHSLRSLNDVQSFIEGIVFIRKEDLAMVCKPCHGIKTYAERYGLSFEDAKATKQAIEFEKKGVKKVVDMLTKSGYNVPSSKDKRRDMLVEYFKQENSK